MLNPIRNHSLINVACGTVRPILKSNHKLSLNFNGLQPDTFNCRSTSNKAQDPFSAQSELGYTSIDSSSSSSHLANTQNIPITCEVTPNHKNPPILILHGVLMSSLNWLNHARRLSRSCNTTIYNCNLRNHGHSSNMKMSYPLMSQDIRALLDSQEIEKAILIGHSMGGKVAMQFALESPERVHRLIVVDTAPMVYDHVTLQTKLIQNMFEMDVQSCQSMPELEQRLRKAIRDDILRNSLFKNIITNSNGQFDWHLHLGSISMSIFNLVVSKFPALPIDPARSIQYPSSLTQKQLLFVQATKSQYLQDAGKEAMKNFFPLAQLISFNCGHLLPQEVEGQFLDAIEPFILEGELN